MTEYPSHGVCPPQLLLLSFTSHESTSAAFKARATDLPIVVTAINEAKLIKAVCAGVSTPSSHDGLASICICRPL